MAGKAKLTKLTKLEQCPCPRWSALREPEGCQPNLAWCGMDGECPYEAVYLRAIADNKCARLLRVFMWWIERWKTWTSYGRRVRQGDEIEAAIRKALKEAGL